jgi:putative hydrolase of the HAD superfamily
MDNIRYIALDADDTLWMNETIFVNTQAACHDIIAPYMDDPTGMDAKLYEYERKNLRLFGYGIKGFMLSMIETAIELSNGRVAGRDIQRIIDLGKEMLEHPVHLLDTVEETVKILADNFFLMVITKGDLFDQENKLARSGIADHFRAVEIVSEKNEATYRDILRRHSIPPDQFLMVGNSVKSDVLPVLQAGGHAIHIPYHFTWELEKVGEHETQGHTYTELGRLGELVPLLLPEEE